MKNRKNCFKPSETELKFRFGLGSVRFQFYYVKNRKVRFNFQLQILIHQTDRNQTEIYYYIIFYIKYIIFCKYLTLTLWDTLWLFLKKKKEICLGSFAFGGGPSSFHFKTIQWFKIGPFFVQSSNDSNFQNSNDPA